LYLRTVCPVSVGTGCRSRLSIGQSGASREGADGDHLSVLVPVIADGVWGPLAFTGPDHISGRYQPIKRAVEAIFPAIILFRWNGKKLRRVHEVDSVGVIKVYRLTFWTGGL